MDRKKIIAKSLCNGRFVRSAKKQILKIGKDMVPLIVEELLNDKKDKICQGVRCEMLGGLKAYQAITAIIQILEQSISEMSFNDKVYLQPKAAIALGEIGANNSKAEHLLIQLVEKGYGSNKRSAAMALGDIKSKKAVKLLLNLLNEKDTSISCAAAESLGKIMDNSSIEPLIKFLNRDDLGDWRCSKNVPVIALKKLTGQDFGDDPDKWMKWWIENK
jgi:HEAT repeat protein